jgi:capsular exopolysaccharide synthesis family protein
MMPSHRHALQEIEPPRTLPRAIHPSVLNRFDEAASQIHIAEELVSLRASDSYVADQYRAIRHNIEWLRRESGLHVLAVTSPSPGDGKSVTSLNLAGALAQSRDTRVLIVDADLRRPSVARYLGLPDYGAPGLADVLEDTTYDLTRVIRRFERYNLSVVPAGAPRPLPYELLNSPRLAEVLTEARGSYDYVVVDTPPLVPLPDCRLIGKSIDGFLIVITAHKTPRKLVTEALNLMDPAKVIGVIFNGADRAHHHYGYYYTNAADRPTRWWQRLRSAGDRRPFGFE